MNILRKFAVFAAFAAAMTVFAGCSDQDQSSLLIEDIQGKVKITGTISYSEGQAYVNGQYAELYKGVVNAPVYVLIKNADLLLDTNALGYTTLETMTDTVGRYEIEIPVPNQGADVILQTPSFTGKHTLLKEWKNNEPIFQTDEVVFYMDTLVFRVSPNEILFKDFAYCFKKRTDASLTETITKIVKVGFGIITEGGELAFEFKPNQLVTIKVWYTNLFENGTNMYREYKKSTDENGEAKFDIPTPSKSLSSISSLGVQVDSLRVSSFTYYDKDSYDVKIIDGGTYFRYGSRYLSDSRDTIGVQMYFLPDRGVETYGYRYWNYEWSWDDFKTQNSK